MPDIFVYKRKIICVVEFPQSGTKFATWSIYNLDNKKISWGYSRGYDKEGSGSVPMAMDNAKRAARREYAKQDRKEK